MMHLEELLYDGSSEMTQRLLEVKRARFSWTRK